MTFKYKIKDQLSKSLSQIEYYQHIYLCAFKINDSCKTPFLQYLLSNNGFNVLEFLSIPDFKNEENEENEYNDIKTKEDTIILYSKLYLSGILKLENVIQFEGFYEHNENLYLFFDISECNITLDETYSSSPYRLALVDEIVNNKNICGIPINQNVVELFVKNDHLIYLYDSANKPYDIPVAAFVGKPTEKKLKFTKIFGESPKDKSAIFGPYFYFTSFHYAIRQGGWSPDYVVEKGVTDEDAKYLKGGLVRFAVFVGTPKIVENMPRDPHDNSFTKQMRLKDDSFDRKKEILTLRITDYDGNWAKEHNSIYLGKIELDDGSFLEDAPILAVKSYYQQVPLSYHFIDTTKLGAKYNETSQEYRIL